MFFIRFVQTIRKIVATITLIDSLFEVGHLEQVDIMSHCCEVSAQTGHNAFLKDIQSSLVGETSLRLHELFERQAIANPEAPALQFETKTLTYRDLNERAEFISSRLSESGVCEGDVIAIALPRSFDFIACCLAIMKSKAAYLPLDISSPTERLRQIITESKTVLLLSDRSLCPSFFSPNVFSSCVAIEISDLENNKSFELPVPRSSLCTSDIACVFYTSGTTGQPKGVMMLHRAIINRQLAIWENVPHLLHEVGCQRANISFVTSLSEIYSNLLRGVKLVLVPEGISQDLMDLVNYLNCQAVTRIFLVPSLLHAFLSIGITQESLPLLKVWVTAGEAIAVNVVDAFKHAFSHSTLLNLFGLTEAGSLVYRIHSPTDKAYEQLKSIPIGKLAPVFHFTYIFLNFAVRCKENPFETRSPTSWTRICYLCLLALLVSYTLVASVLLVDT